MAVPQFEHYYKVDLALPLQKRTTNGLFTLNDMGHKIGVDVYKNGAMFALSSTVVRGKVRKADGTTVTINGTVENGNRAVIEIPDTVFTVIGPIQIIIRGQNSASTSSITNKTTLLVLQGYVIQD